MYAVEKTERWVFIIIQKGALKLASYQRQINDVDVEATPCSVSDFCHRWI